MHIQQYITLPFTYQTKSKPYYALNYPSIHMRYKGPCKCCLLATLSPIEALEKLFFALFGQITLSDLNYVSPLRPLWTQSLFKFVFGAYLLMSVVVLITLLIAMMSDTYQRIQVILLSHSTPLFTVTMNPIYSFELLFFAVFGQTTTEQTRVHRNDSNTQPAWTNYLFKIVFGIYMLVSVVVLINLLIAMMSDTYQRIQVMHT